MINTTSKKWKTQTLRDIADIIMGQAPKSDFYNEVREGTPFIAGAGDFGKKSPMPKKYTTNPLRLSKKGDIILSVRATIGDLNWADKEYCYGRGVAGIRVRKNIEPEFIYYWLLLNKKTFLSMARGATFKQISIKDISKLLTPVPPITDQRRIVARIKACMERIEEIQKLREETKENIEILLSSLIEEVCKCDSGNEFCLGEVCEITNSLIDPRQSKFKSLIHVGGSNIISGTGELINLKTSAEEKLISGKHFFSKIDILYSKIRPNLKKVTMPGFIGLCSADIYPLRAKKDIILRDFLFYVLLSKDFTKYAVCASNRAGIPKINRKQLFAYKFNLPKLETQLSLVGKFNNAYESLLQMKKEADETMQYLKKLKQAVLRKAFSGEW